MIEEWKELDNYSRYLISNTGEVTSKSTGVTLSQTINGGFWCLNLVRDDGVKELSKVHRLVAKAFVPNPTNLKIVEHIEDRLDNTYTNIQWKPLKDKPEKKEKRTFTYKGTIYSEYDFASFCDITIHTLRYRYKAGWSERECVVGFKDFTGQGYILDNYWFPTKTEMQNYEVLKLRTETLKTLEEKRLQKEADKLMRKESRRVCGVGIADVEITEETLPFYQRWAGMLTRGHSENFKLKYPSYRDKYVIEDWRRLSIFKAWMEIQNWKGLELDKDILVKGNKEYGPQTCCFVPQRINSLLTGADSSRGEFPIGVTLQPRKKNDKYLAKIKKEGKPFEIGLFNTPEEAHAAWQLEKSNEIFNTVKWYSGQDCFDTKVADALLSRAWGLLIDRNNRQVTTKL